MAAPKGKDKLNKLFDEIIIDIAENGKAIRDAIKTRMSSSTFYELLEDEKKLKRYARATEIRSDKMAEETLIIADDIEGDTNRDRLRVDSRKWLLSKLHPKKYGEKIDMTSGNESLKPNVNINVVSSDSANKLKEFIDGKPD